MNTQAKVPSIGSAVFDVQPAETAASSTLKVTENSLENARYRITLNGDGDVASIFDKALSRELLSAPARLAFKTVWTNLEISASRAISSATRAGPFSTTRILAGPPTYERGGF